jgi:hypothetical protein
MLRLILQNENPLDYDPISRIRNLKRNLNLTWCEAIKIWWKLERNHTVYIQSCKNERAIDMRLESAYFNLRFFYLCKLEDIPYNMVCIPDAKYYPSFLKDYIRGIRIFIEK